MESKESPTEGAREQEDGAKWRQNMEGKGGRQEESPMPSNDPEKEQVTVGPHKHGAADVHFPQLGNSCAYPEEIIFNRKC